MNPHADDARLSDTELAVSRVARGRRHLVFEVFTDQAHLGHWWGPAGFSISTHSFEFAPDGVWEFTMHGPDGTDYPNWIQWVEIAVPDRIVMRHGAGADDPEMFTSTITFVPVVDGTEVTLRSEFPTKELCDRAVEEFGAIEGGRQTLGRLAAYMASPGMGQDETDD